MRKIVRYLERELSKRHKVLTVRTKRLASWAEVRAFHPDIIHSVLTPTTPGFVEARLMALCFPSAKRVISAPQASALRFRRLLRHFRPDLVLTQSDESERMLQSLGMRTEFLPNGVDPETFHPVTAEAKAALRDRYGVPSRTFVALHVGPVKKGRNLRWLTRLQTDGCQVLVLGRPSQTPEEDLRQELLSAGCWVWPQYVEAVQEVYQLSDAYVFPTLNPLNCIETPLSVLEAMACNLPVITTRFGALPRLFSEAKGLSFVDSEEELSKGVAEARAGGCGADTRRVVSPYSWAEVVDRLEKIYGDLVG
ncbi:MAG: glycosyltransferase family 4 protein [Chloroflexota bacterium]